MNTWRNKKVIVTGGSRGIGLAICQKFIRAGYDVTSISKSATYHSWSSVDTLHTDSGPGVDLLDPQARLKLNLDCGILVNNACTQSFGQAAKTDIQPDLEWIKAYTELCQKVYFQMAFQSWGRIINLSSIAGVQGTRGTLGYSLDKAAVIELTKCLSNEWAIQGITVNTVVPGYITTEMLHHLLMDAPHAAEIKGRIPIGEWGKPEDVAEAVFFLASDEARYITGVTLPVDGGWLQR